MSTNLWAQVYCSDLEAAETYPSLDLTSSKYSISRESKLENETVE
jgi:hypothetical protein